VALGVIGARQDRDRPFSIGQPGEAIGALDGGLLGQDPCDHLATGEELDRRDRLGRHDRRDERALDAERPRQVGEARPGQRDDEAAGGQVDVGDLVGHGDRQGVVLLELVTGDDREEGRSQRDGHDHRDGDVRAAEPSTARYVRFSS
jgi:hypothetical protein